MKKYKILKWLVLFVAVCAVLAFLIPFSNPTDYLNNGDSWTGYLFENSLTPNGTPLGFEFVFGKAMFSNSVLTTAIWLSRISFVIALAAVAVAVLPLVLHDVNGLNKKGKFHIEMLISPALAFLSALINFITFQACSAKVSQAERIRYGESYTYEYHTINGNYTYIALIVIAVLLVLIAILAVKAKREIASGQAAPQTEYANPVASAVHSQTTQTSVKKQSQINILEDKPMTKKEAEGMLAYIWVRQYNTLPFDEALDKIMAYLIESKMVITPEMEAEICKPAEIAETVESTNTSQSAAVQADGKKSGVTKFAYSMSDAEAIVAFKKGFMGQGVGNVAILSEKGKTFTLGAPMMTVTVEFNNGICTTKASLMGKTILATVNTKIELIDGFKKL